MANVTFRRLAFTALAVTTMFSAQFAMAEVVAGSVIKLSSGSNTGTGGGGAFYGSVVSGSVGTWNNSFQTFCVEYNEHIAYNTEYKVKSVTDHTVSNIASGVSANGDVISNETAWLFTEFYSITHGASNTTLWGSSGIDATKTTALQQAIWYFEDERNFDQMNATAKTYISLANAAVDPLDGWKNNGSVKVLNLVSNNTNAYHKQDQLYMTSAVPEPESYALLLAGLGVVGAVARRRKVKSV